MIFLHGYPFDHTNEKMLDDVLRQREKVCQELRNPAVLEMHCRQVYG